jgi:hypothetical protein
VAQKPAESANIDIKRREAGEFNACVPDRFHRFITFSSSVRRSEWMPFLEPLELENFVDTLVEQKFALDYLANLTLADMMVLFGDNDINVPLGAIAGIYAAKKKRFQTQA